MHKRPLFPHRCQQLLFIFLLITIILKDVEWYLIVVLICLLSSFFPFFKLFFNFFIVNNFFILILITLFFSFFPSFFLPFHHSHVADRVLVLRLGVRPVPLRWESWVQDIGPPETARLHVIPNGERSPRGLHFNAKTQLHSTTSKLQCWTPYAK